MPTPICEAVAAHISPMHHVDHGGSVVDFSLRDRSGIISGRAYDDQADKFSGFVCRMACCPRVTDPPSSRSFHVFGLRSRRFRSARATPRPAS
ncbi:hypothetical protein FOA52_009655 [Chlamydomonas sp. UWO 241]|nr:hypothetical protein FOA52_009655 [Chlamydomonas sp. UWO 241]